MAVWGLTVVSWDVVAFLLRLNLQIPPVVDLEVGEASSFDEEDLADNLLGRAEIIR